MPVRPDGDTLRAALGTVVSATAAPYGYTVTLWSAGALLIHQHGFPRPADVFLFLTGALLGFALVGSFAHGALRTRAPITVGPGARADRDRRERRAVQGRSRASS